MIENIKSQMRKGVLEYCILLILNQQEAYATEIIEMLDAADLLVVEGTLYPLLTRMKNANLLSYHWEESKAGPPRKYYKITDSGRTELNELSTEWSAISNSVSKINQTRIYEGNEDY